MKYLNGRWRKPDDVTHEQLCETWAESAFWVFFQPNRGYNGFFASKMKEVELVLDIDLERATKLQNSP